MAYTDNFVTGLIALVDDLVTADKIEFSELLFQDTFETSDIADTHTVVTGVRNGTLIPILLDTPNPESFPFVDQTDCVPADCDVSHDFGSHKWELGLIECRVGICLRTFDENFLKFFNAFKWTQEGEPDLDTAMLRFIADKFLKNLRLATWRTAYFSDKASASPYLDEIDGIFTQMEANTDQIVPITENAGADFAAQTLTGEEVFNYLQAMYDQAALQPWFDPTIMEYRITRAMGAALVSYLNKLGKEAPTNCNCIDPATAVSRNVFMLDGLTFNGVPVFVYNEWDDIINYMTTLNGGGGAAARVNPNRAILTYRENVLIGTTLREALESFDIWYSKDDKKVYLEGSAYLGGGVPQTSQYILAI